MAIAFDVATNGGSTTATSLTYAHTCTGDNRILFVGVLGNVSDTYNITGVTYGGVSLTQISTAIRIPTDRIFGLWMLVNPASGSNDVVASSSPSGFIQPDSFSYTGALQTGQPDATGTNVSTTGTSLTASVTTVADKSWAFAYFSCRTGVTSAGASTTSRDLTTSQLFCDSGADVTPAGSRSLIVNNTQSVEIAGIICSFSPAAAAAANNPTLLTLGVG